VLAAPPVVHYVPLNAAVPPACPGTAESPEAQPGHLCVYESQQQNAELSCAFNPVTDLCQAASRQGFGVFTDAVAAGKFWVQGSWAVTAP
jgi:hypothetical protein